MVRALIKHRLGRTQQALEDIETHLELWPNGLPGNEAVAHTLKGNLLVAERKHEEARRAFDVAFRLNGQYFPAAKGLWTCYNELKQHLAASIAAQKMREIDPVNLGSIEASAISYFKTERYEAAKHYFNDWKSARPADSLPVSMIAACELAMGRPARAIQLYDEALAIAPSDDHIRLAKAVVLSDCKDDDVRNPTAALHELASVLERKRATLLDAEVVILISLVQYQCGDKETAIDTINERLNDETKLTAENEKALRALATSFERNEKFDVSIPRVVTGSSSRIRVR